LSYEPGVVVPDLPGNSTFASAPNTLRSAGLQPGNFLCDRDLSGTPNAPVGKVTRFDPPAGTRVAANKQINMFAVQPNRCITFIIRPEIFRAIETTRLNSVIVRDHR
jgi:beta-lactam-binding protein with PASTA domain